MKNLEMKIDGEKLLIRHPDGVVVMLDFANVRPDLAAGAAYICGIRVAAKPTDAASGEPPASLRRASGEPPASLRRASGDEVTPH